MSSEDDASVSTEGDDTLFTEKSDESDSEAGEDDEDSTPPRRRKRKLSTDDSVSSDDSYKKTKKRKKVQKKPGKSKSTARSPKSVKKVVYKEEESESESEESEADDADLIEDDDTMMTEVSMQQVDDSNAETIEKVLKHREGIPGAIGPPTTAYNVEEKGDPNQGVEGKDPSELERQFLIKWVGWSHLHNTWESLKSLNGSNVKGIKKLENYIKKLDELEFW
jgi:hypothetical protein